MGAPVAAVPPGVVAGVVCGVAAGSALLSEPHPARASDTAVTAPRTAKRCLREMTKANTWRLQPRTGGRPPCPPIDGQDARCDLSRKSRDTTPNGLTS